MITLDQIQKKLNDAIQQSTMTQTAIAHALNIEPTQLCNYLKGSKIPANIFANLCKLLDIDANDILCIND